MGCVNLTWILQLFAARVLQCSPNGKQLVRLSGDPRQFIRFVAVVHLVVKLAARLTSADAAVLAQTADVVSRLLDLFAKPS